jgi:transformation/transcription domain-associated protein
MLGMKKHAATRMAMANSSTNSTNAANPSRRPESDQPTRDKTSDSDAKRDHSGNDVAPRAPPPVPQTQPDASGSDQQRPAPLTAADSIHAYISRPPLDFIDEILQIQKTASPLLNLTLETLVEALEKRFKPAPEEEIYRLICMLLGEAIQVSLDISIPFRS